MGWQVVSIYSSRADRVVLTNVGIVMTKTKWQNQRQWLLLTGIRYVLSMASFDNAGVDEQCPLLLTRRKRVGIEYH